jgi:O-antigen/teichoic acid export membrane protein
LNVLKNISSYTLVNFGIKSFAIVTLPIIAKTLTVEQFGLYTILLSIIYFSQSLLMFGFEHSLNFFYYKEKTNSKTLVSTQLFFLIFVSLFLTILTYFIFKNKIDNLLYILTWVTLNLLFTYFNVLTRVKFDIKYFSIANGVKGIIFLGLIYLLLVEYKMKIKGIIFANILSLIFPVLLLYYYNRSIIRLKFSRNLLKEIFIYGLALVPVGLIFWGSTQMDRYFILYYLNEYILGIYGFAISIALLPNLLKNAIKGALEPYFMKAYHNNEKSLSKLLSVFFTANLIVFSFVFLFISLFSKEIVQILGNENYLDSLKYIPFLTLIVLISSVNQFFIYGINFKSKNNKILKYLTITFITNLILSFLLVQKIFVMGVILANIISNILYSFLLYKQSYRLFPVKFFNTDQSFLLVSVFISFITYMIFSFHDLIIIRFSILLICILLNKKLIFRNFKEIKNCA